MQRPRVAACRGVAARPLFTGVLQFPLMHFTSLKMAWIEWKQLISEKISIKSDNPA
jgi:hypothetical protein